MADILDSLVVSPTDPAPEPMVASESSVPIVVAQAPQNPPGGTDGPKIPPKKRFGGVGMFLIILVLLIALPVGVYFISQKDSLNDIRNLAAKSCFDKCREEKGTKYCNDECGTNNVVTPKPGPGEDELVRGVGGKTGCDAAGGFWCGDFCISGKTKTCNQTIIEQGGTVSVGSVKCVKSGSTWIADPAMKYSDKTGPGAIGVVNGKSVLQQVNEQCAVQMPAGGFGTQSYICKEGVKGYSGGQCTANNGVAFTGNLGCFCGTVQVDTGAGHQSYTSTCGCNEKTPDPTNPPTNTPTSSTTPTSTATPTATTTPTATPTPQVGCDYGCTVNTDCNNGLVCASGKCRNQQCTEQSSCQCVTNTNTPTPTPPPIVYAECNSPCTVNTDCSSGLVCIDSACRNPSCTEKTSCQCEVAAAPTPQTPVAGAGPSILGASVIASGFLLLLLGLAL